MFPIQVVLLNLKKLFLKAVAVLLIEMIGYGLIQIAQMTLGSGNLQLAVELPAGEDLNEWLAVNTIDFYNESNSFSHTSKCFIRSIG